MEKIVMTASLLAAQTLNAATQADVYFGTYTHQGTSEGIYHAVLDTAQGKLSKPELAVKTPNPSFIEIHPNGKFLYAVNEDENGEIKAFAIDSGTKKLQLINQQPSGGAHPCHIAIDRNGKNLLVSNYSSGSVEAVPINPDGSLAEPSCLIQHHGSGINRQRQQAPHAHSANFSPDGRLALVADLGRDKIMLYRFDANTGKLTANDPASGTLNPGAGPRHLTFHPGGKWVYVINELDKTVTVFAYDADTGSMTMVQEISTLPTDFRGSSLCAEVKVSQDGHFLYGSNRGHDSLVTYRIDPGQGTLTTAGWQSTNIKNPRNFNFDPSEQFCLVANQDGNSVVIFRCSPQTGLLEPTGKSIALGSPVCVRFLCQ